MQRCTKIHLHGSNDWSLERKDTSCKLQSENTFYAIYGVCIRPQALFRMFSNLPFKGLDENLIKLSVSPLSAPSPSLRVCTPCPNSASGFWEPNIRTFKTKLDFSVRTLSDRKKCLLTETQSKVFSYISKVVYPLKWFNPFRMLVDDHGANIQTFLVHVHDILTDSFCRNISLVIFRTHHLVCSNLVG